jgi:hypothetical protein
VAKAPARRSVVEVRSPANEQESRNRVRRAAVARIHPRAVAEADVNVAMVRGEIRATKVNHRFPAATTKKATRKVA